MGNERKTLAAELNKSVHSKVESYRDKMGHDTKKAAVEDLIKTGLREKTNPVVARWYDATIRWVGFVLVVAILSLIAGLSGVVDTINGAKFAAGCLFVAVILLSLVEGAKLYYGQSELGAWIRGDE